MLLEAWLDMAPSLSPFLTLHNKMSGYSQLADVVDPYVYRERLTMPKLVIDSGGDEFFQVRRREGRGRG